MRDRWDWWRLPASTLTLAALLALFTGPSIARAATITVDAGGDSGSGCTLRNAIDSADANEDMAGCTGSGAYGDDTIDVPASVGPTITLNGAELSVGASGSGKLDIVGPGAADLTVSGNDASRVFHVTADARDAADAVTISGLTISHGLAQLVNPGGSTDSSVGGAGVLNEGTLTLDHVRVTANHATATVAGGVQLAMASGAGIQTVGGALTVDHGTIDANTASAELENDGSANGHATAEGAGIDFGSNGDLTITDTTVSGNQANAKADSDLFSAGVGGIGIDLLNAGSVEIDRSTISGNSGDTRSSVVSSGSGSTVYSQQDGGGGGLLLEGGGTATVSGSTIANNSVNTLPNEMDNASTSSGGGIWSSVATTLTSDTIAGNTAQHGVALVWSPAGTMSFENTIFSGHTATAADCEEAGIGGSMNSLGHNLSDDASCAPTGTGDIENTNPGLLSLGDHGGPTQTEPPDVNSPAIDQGVAAGQNVDQRGLQRTWEFDTADGASGDGTDIGAVEIQGATPTGTSPASPGTSGSPSVLGTVEGNSEVFLFDGSSCGGSAIAQGSSSDFVGSGLNGGPVAPDTTATFSVDSTYGTARSVCSTPITYSRGPLPPTLTGTSPASGTDDNDPKVLGTAEAASTVTLYTNPSCSGPVAGSGTAADLASPGIPVTVADNSTTTFYGTVTNAIGTSGCSAGISYSEVTPVPPAPSTATAPPAALPTQIRKCKKARKGTRRHARKRCKKAK